MAKKISIIFMTMCTFMLIVKNYSFGFVLNPGGYKPWDTTTVSESNKLMELANNIIGPIKIIGSIISVIALVIIGIKYILGSVEERAEYKETMKPYVIGAILLFGITNLLNIVVEIVGGF